VFVDDCAAALLPLAKWRRESVRLRLERAPALSMPLEWVSSFPMQSSHAETPLKLCFWELSGTLSCPFIITGVCPSACACRHAAPHAAAWRPGALEGVQGKRASVHAHTQGDRLMRVFVVQFYHICTFSGV
jgi:hypothetical protein